MKGTRTICGKSGCNDKDGTDPNEFPTVILSENEVVAEPMPVEDDDEVDEIVIAIQFEGDAADSMATLNFVQVIIVSIFLFIMH